jgi:hypothetical protein
MMILLRQIWDHFYSAEYEQQKVIIREAAETTIVLVHGLE